ncbi:putative Glycoside hydrolase superfamily [Seiridium cardinale]
MTPFVDRVPVWFTICEPNMGPLFLLPDYNGITALAKAHVPVYHWRYKDELNGTGRISTKFANNLAVPFDPINGSHLQASIPYQEFILGIMANPIFLGKQIPNVVLDTPGLNVTALPTSGHSTPTSLSSPTHLKEARRLAWAILQTLFGPLASRPPQYVREQLGYVWNTYKSSGVMVTEFGFPQISESEQHELSVQQFAFARFMYYQNFLTETLHAIHSNKVNVIGALPWGLD